jgi:hypothetical protein
MGLQLSMYMEKIRYLPNSVEEVRGRDNIDWLEDVLVNLLKKFRLTFFEESSWLPSEWAGEMELLKKLRIAAISTMVRNNRRCWAASQT